jgi:hypothetical protein
MSNGITQLHINIHDNAAAAAAAADDDDEAPQPILSTQPQQPATHLPA